MINARIPAMLCAAVLLAGCGHAHPPQPSGPPSSPLSTAASASSVSPGTTALRRLAESDARLFATIEGTLEIDRPATVAGTYEQSGRDFHITLDTTMAGIDFTVEQKVVADQSYMLNPGRPWQHDIVASGSHRAPTLAEALAGTEVSGSAGSEEIAGTAVDRYRLEGLVPGNLTAALGLSDPGARPTGASSTLLASAAGEPVALDLRYSLPTSDAIATSDLRLTFKRGTAIGSIAAPADPWVTKAQGHGYTIWYPERWQAVLDPSDGDFTDAFSGPDENVTVFCSPDAALSLEVWAQDGLTFYTKYFGGAPDSSNDSMLGEIPTKVSVWLEGTVDGEKRGIVNVALVNGSTGCDIQWIRAPGPIGDQESLFRDALATFAFD